MDDLKPGDLLFLTKAYEDYVRKNYPNLNICLVNRLAKLEEIIDWEGEKGQNIKKVRESNEKWKNLPLEDNKYILSVYYHDIKGRKGESGVVERGSFFRYHPKTKKPFFVKVPDWIYKNIRANCDSFEVIIED